MIEMMSQKAQIKAKLLINMSVNVENKNEILIKVISKFCHGLIQKSISFDAINFTFGLWLKAKLQTK